MTDTSFLVGGERGQSMGSKTERSPRGAGGKWLNRGHRKFCAAGLPLYVLLLSDSNLFPLLSQPRPSDLPEVWISSVKFKGPNESHGLCCYSVWVWLVWRYTKAAPCPGTRNVLVSKPGSSHWLCNYCKVGVNDSLQTPLEFPLNIYLLVMQNAAVYQSYLLNVFMSTKY